MKGKTMIDNLKLKLTDTTIQKGNQEFITGIAILLYGITIHLLPIVIALFIWNDLFSIPIPKDSIYYALHLLLDSAYQLNLKIFCLSIIIDILFTIFTIILIYRKKN